MSSRIQQNTAPGTVSFGEAFRTAEGVEHHYQLPLPGVEGSGRFVICSGMAIADGCITSGRADLSWQHFNERPFVEMNFVMAGSLYQTHGALIQRQLQQRGYHNLLFNPSSWEKNELADTSGFRNLGIHITPEKMIALFTDYAPELEHLAVQIDKAVPFVLHAPAKYFSPKMQFILDNIWNSPDAKGLKRLHFETQIMELLCLQCAAILSGNTLRTALRTADQEKLHFARQLLLQRLADPPSLAELARLCGINEFKLKKGFRQLFQQTVFGFVSEQRLEMARQQICQGDKNISEIAYGLGYTHPQHFHRAFKKRFGITPMGLIK